MIYFFHHYELPAILQQAQIQHIIINSQQQRQQPDQESNHEDERPDNNENNNNDNNRRPDDDANPPPASGNNLGSESNSSLNGSAPTNDPSSSPTSSPSNNSTENNYNSQVLNNSDSFTHNSSHSPSNTSKISFRLSGFRTKIDRIFHPSRVNESYNMATMNLGAYTNTANVSSLRSFRKKPDSASCEVNRMTTDSSSSRGRSKLNSLIVNTRRRLVTNF